MSESDVDVPLVQRHHDRFTARNGYLYALLGMMSAGNGLEKLLAEVGSPETDVEGSSEPEGSALIDLVLGLVAVERSAVRIIREFATHAPPADEVAPPAQSRRGVGLLR